MTPARQSARQPIDPPPRWKLWLYRTLCVWGMVFFGGLAVIGIAANALWPTVPNLMLAVFCAILLGVKWETG